MLLFQACSLFTSGGVDEKTQNSILGHRKVNYTLEENAGRFILQREKGLKEKTKEFVVKKTIFPGSGDRKKILEKSVSISQFGKLKNNLTILRPYKSQYNVWFDGKLYSSELELNVKKKSFDLTLKSPEKKWSGTQSISFPNSNSVYCFFEQLVECIAITGFLSMAKDKGLGRMNFYIVWNGYPYFQDQYLNLPKELFTQAHIEYDGLDEQGKMKLSLHVGNQVMFYIVNKNGHLVKQFWVAQGLSMIESGK